MQRLSGLRRLASCTWRFAAERAFATEAEAVVSSGAVTSEVSKLTGRQAHVRFVTPQNSGRNYIRRVLARQLQVTREAAERRAATSKALQSRDAARVERWRQRAAWKAEATAAAATRTA